MPDQPTYHDSQPTRDVQPTYTTTEAMTSSSPAMSHAQSNALLAAPVPLLPLPQHVELVQRQPSFLGATKPGSLRSVLSPGSSGGLPWTPRGPLSSRRPTGSLDVALDADAAAADADLPDGFTLHLHERVELHATLNATQDEWTRKLPGPGHGILELSQDSKINDVLARAGVPGECAHPLCFVRADIVADIGRG